MCIRDRYPFANAYFTICAAGTAFSLIGMGMNQFILAQGYAKQGMLAVTVGAVINILLDPLLIFKLGMGISGAAYATVIAQFFSMIYVLRFLRRNDTPMKVKLGGYSGRTAVKILSIGIMSFLITLLDNFIIILLNATLRRYAPGDMGDLYIACACLLYTSRCV